MRPTKEITDAIRQVEDKIKFQEGQRSVWESQIEFAKSQIEKIDAGIVWGKDLLVRLNEELAENEKSELTTIRVS